MAERLSRKAFQDRFAAVVTNIEKVIKGKREIVELTLIAMLADGHVLFEDMPGTGKTMLARTVAETINATSSRIQCTPDLLPADITGSPRLHPPPADLPPPPRPLVPHLLPAG